MRTSFVISGKLAGGLAASAVLAISLSTVSHASTSIFAVGSPPTSVAQNRYYGFQTWATDTTGKPVTYGIKNKPAWATFDTRYGHLYGVPTSANVGVYSNITIYATDGISSAYLPAFNITVTGTGGSTGGTGGSTTTGSATVHWTPPLTNTNGSTLTNLAGYIVSYHLSTSNTPTTVKVANPGLTSYQIDGLTAGTWSFAVSAYTTAGTTSSLSNTATKTIQ
jgi:hypothetical protein